MKYYLILIMYCSFRSCVLGQLHAIILVMHHVQCEHNDITSMTCQCKASHDDIMPTWSSYNVNANHVMPTPCMCGGWEWNVNTNDIMPMWFTSHASLHYVMSGMHELCVHQQKTIHITYCPTEEMIADFFTKSFQGSLFLKMHDLIMGMKMPTPALTSSRSVLGEPELEPEGEHHANEQGSSQNVNTMPMNRAVIECSSDMMMNRNVPVM